MLEGQVAFYLNKYLGNYVYGLDPQSLKISVFKGDVQLNNLHLKPEALNALNLPITVKAGLLGSLTLKVRQLLYLVVLPVHQKLHASRLACLSQAKRLDLPSGAMGQLGTGACPC